MRALIVLATACGFAVCASWITFESSAQSVLQDELTARTLDRLSASAAISSGQEFFKDAYYSGSASCKDCHPQEHLDWSKTLHSRMLRVATPNIVQGDFNNRKIVHQHTDEKGNKIEYEIWTSRSGDTFSFTIKDKDDPANDQKYDIALVVGNKWDQHYHVKVKVDGTDKYFPAPIRWSIKAKDWQSVSRFSQWWVKHDKTSDGRPLKPDELSPKRFAEPRCMGCHTTGYQFVPADDKDPHEAWSMQGSPGFSGEFGIGCERCHGPGSKHIQEAKAAGGKPLVNTTIVNPKNLTALQQNQVCTQCHGRNTNKVQPVLQFQDRYLALPFNGTDRGFLPGDINMSDRVRFWSYPTAVVKDEVGYFWHNDWARKNRQQSQDFAKSTHYSRAELSCISCHVFHGDWAPSQLRYPVRSPDPKHPLDPTKMLCTSCHRSGGVAERANSELYIGGNAMYNAGVECVDCHMPRIGKRTDDTFETVSPFKPRPAIFDTSAHTFNVALPRMQKADESIPNIGKDDVMPNACSVCHEPGKTPWGTPAPKYSVDELDQKLTLIQVSTRTKLQAVEKRIAAYKSPPPSASALLTQATAKLNVVLLDGSMGFHNPSRAAALIRAADKLVDQACQLQPDSC